MNNKFLITLVLLFLVGCATPALELPSANGDMAKPMEGVPENCEEIAMVQKQIRKRLVAIETEIAASRQRIKRSAISPAGFLRWPPLPITMK